MWNMEYYISHDIFYYRWTDSKKKNSRQTVKRSIYLKIKGFVQGYLGSRVSFLFSRKPLVNSIFQLTFKHPLLVWTPVVKHFARNFEDYFNPANHRLSLQLLGFRAPAIQGEYRGRTKPQRLETEPSQSELPSISCLWETHFLNVFHRRANFSDSVLTINIKKTGKNNNNKGGSRTDLRRGFTFFRGLTTILNTKYWDFCLKKYNKKRLSGEKLGKKLRKAKTWGKKFVQGKNSPLPSPHPITFLMIDPL